MAVVTNQFRVRIWQGRGSRGGTAAVAGLCLIQTAAGLLAGCERPPAPVHEAASKPAVAMTPPNILLITVCTFRYDHLSGAGYPRPTMPYLESLAADGAFFESAISTSSWTQPAAVSILTGLTPGVHRMTVYQSTDAVNRRTVAPQRLLSDQILTLGECLARAGYATFCRINNVQTGHFFNIPRGFDDGRTEPGADTWRMLQELKEWLSAHDRSRPFFAFLFTRDPHMIYDPGYEYYCRFNRSSETLTAEQYENYPGRLDAEVKKARKDGVPAELQRQYVDLYDAELAQLDDVLSRIPGLLSASGCAHNTVIVVTGDHGECFFEQGRIGHAWGLEEALVRVPLILKGPGIPAGLRLKEVVRTIDIYPTLAALAGAAVPDVAQGRSLLPLLRGEAEQFVPLTAFATFERATDRGPLVMQMVRDAQFKLYNSQRLYDIENDPTERNNLYAVRPDVVARLSVKLRAWLDEEEGLRTRIAEGGTRPLTPEIIDQLRSLGYVR